MEKNSQKKEQLDTNLFLKIIGDKIDLLVKLKEQRDAIIAQIKSEYIELDSLKKQKKQINQQIKINKRAIVRDENERFKLNRELNKQVKLSNKLNIKYSNEMNESINSQKFYPETIQKTR